MSLRRSILTAVPVLAATAAAASPAVAAAAPQTVHVGCMGTGKACTATVNLAGGASNERVVVSLPSSKLRLVSTKPSSSTLQGAYSVSDQARRANGRKYVFTLNAVQSIPNGSTLTLRFKRSTHSKTQIVRCQGTANNCKAKVSIAGGASNRPVVIQLPGVDLGLTSVKPSSSTLAGAYDVSNQHFRQGNSEYAFTLSAPQAAPAGSYLTFRFNAF
jgi:hypothetical protein